MTKAELMEVLEKVELAARRTDTNCVLSNGLFESFANEIQRMVIDIIVEDEDE